MSPESSSRMAVVFALSIAAALLALLPAGLAGRSVQRRNGQEAPPAGRVAGAVVELLAVGPGSKGKNLECGATGFLINSEGYILTNAHVVEEARRCLAGASGAKILAKPSSPHPSVGKAVSCNVVKLDELHDLALLKTERPLFADPAEAESNVAPLHAAEIEDGTEVAVVGHPEFAWQARIQTGRIVRHDRVALSEASSAASEVLVVDIALHKGNSGSPVYLAPDGGVVGIAERKDILRPSQAVAVPVRYAIELLDREGVRWFADTR